jgi:hypothetical protein
MFVKRRPDFRTCVRALSAVTLHHVFALGLDIIIPFVCGILCVIASRDKRNVKLYRYIQGDSISDTVQCSTYLHLAMTQL